MKQFIPNVVCVVLKHTGKPYLVSKYVRKKRQKTMKSVIRAWALQEVGGRREYTKYTSNFLKLHEPGNSFKPMAVKQ